MRPVGLFFILMGLLLLVGCSEKQKEAARLEAQMKQQQRDDMAVAGEAGDTVSGTTELSVEGANRQSESLTSGTQGLATAIASESGVASDSAQTVALGRSDTMGRVAESSQVGQAGESEPIPDAGAIPDEEKIKTMVERQSGLVGGFVVQIASTPDRAYAQSLAATFVERGYQAYVTTAEVNGAKYFRVRIGRFATLTEARQIAAQLEAKYAVAGFVTEVQ